MEGMKLFSDIYKGKNILITGHTGFKGSWLSLWLKNLGANIIGYSLEASKPVSHFELLNLSIDSYIEDVSNLYLLKEVVKKYKPVLIFHLAAQPLVRESYRNPVNTYQTNIIGTLNVYEAAKCIKELKGIVSITTDKVYENREWIYGYRENDLLGGHDPYSASKACVEILSESYRKSFFNEVGINLSTARAGNVIGGGDWASERLIPDIIKSTINNEKVFIRNPHSIRPWQHVLEPLAGYLQLGEKILKNQGEASSPWNFSPSVDQNLEVIKMLEISKKAWSNINYEVQAEHNNFHEAKTLKLDNTKSLIELGWKPIWDINKTIEMTIDWYRSWYEKKIIISELQLKQYILDAEKASVGWCNL